MIQLRLLFFTKDLLQPRAAAPIQSNGSPIQGKWCNCLGFGEDWVCPFSLLGAPHIPWQGFRKRAVLSLSWQVEDECGNWGTFEGDGSSLPQEPWVLLNPANLKTKSAYVLAKA